MLNAMPAASANDSNVWLALATANAQAAQACRLPTRLIVEPDLAGSKLSSRIWPARSAPSRIVELCVELSKIVEPDLAGSLRPRAEPSRASWLSGSARRAEPDFAGSISPSGYGEQVDLPFVFYANSCLQVKK